MVIILRKLGPEDEKEVWCKRGVEPLDVGAFKGRVITGKWHQGTYQILRLLGQGGTGAVFLVKESTTGDTYAMKITTDNLSLNREYQRLKKFQSYPFVVKVYGLDDYQLGGQLYHFLLLEYLPGKNLKTQIERHPLKTREALEVVLQLSEMLQVIHREGYILGDLKLENLIISPEHGTLRLIDLGGMVPQGSGIKEYTPAYDRSSWQCGPRRAEPSYDYFSLNLLLLRLILGKGINPYKQHRNELIHWIQKASIQRELKSFMIGNILHQKNLGEGFEKHIKELYNRERDYEKRNAKVKQSWVIDGLLVVSAALMGMTWILLIWGT